MTSPLRSFFFSFALIGVLGVALPSSAHVGFAGGNRFHYAQAVGDVWVQCPTAGHPGYPPGPATASYRCYGYTFGPAEAAQFIGPRIDADEVELTAYRADGSIRTKSGSYNGLRGHSVDAFNLWMDTVFQRALIGVGRNDVSWTLKRAGQIVMSGTFLAEVFQGPGLMCPSVTQTSWDPQDCISPNRVCSDYYYNFGRQCR